MNIPPGVVEAATGEPRRELLEWSAEPISNPFGTPTTESLLRVRGVVAVDGTRRTFSTVAKTVRSIRHFPHVAVLPPGVQDVLDAMLPWRVEPDVYVSGLHDALPPELRAPRLYALEELSGERARLWIEDIGAVEPRWDAEIYAAAARALGRLAGRYPAEAIPFEFKRMRFDSDAYLEQRVGRQLLPLIEDGAVWEHPFMRDLGDPGLRTDLQALWHRRKDLVALLDGVPSTLVHGDACPQNLFVEDGAAGTRFVAIDWGLAGVGPIGRDLAQLLAGRVESGDLDARDVASLEDVVLDAFHAGLDAEGMAMDADELGRAYAACLVMGCTFTALPLERIADARADDRSLALLFQRRARWARYLLDRAAALVGSPA